MFIPIWSDLLFLIFIISGIIVVSHICFPNFLLKVKNYIKKKWDAIYGNNLILRCASFYVFIFLVASFFAPNILVPIQSEQDPSKIATTINGLMSPFIAIAAAILTFMAFWVQYNANLKINSENKRQQTERQFYEMLRIRQESLNNLTLDIPTGTIGESKKIHGQEVFSVLRKEFDLIFKIVNYKYPSKNEAFEKAYAIFFWGFKAAKKDTDIYRIIKELICDIPEDDKLHKLIKEFDIIIDYDAIRDVIYNAQKLYQNTNNFAAGRINILDPYYRHLYFMVKTIACSKSFENSKDEKSFKNAFLKLLRAQMTSDEQILLLYNWHSKLGQKWESSEENQFFFTEWEMIHNIFPEDCVFNEQEILNLFPNASVKQKAEMFEHIKP